MKNTQIHIINFLETIFNHHHINAKTLKFLIPPKKPRTSLFYNLPKIHKPDIPGRPIVSSVNSLTENISEFLTLCIKPITPKLKSYIKDTKEKLYDIQK